MTTSGYIVITIAVAGMLVLWYRAKTKHTMKRISDMLDAARQGSFQEATYDESMLSAVEAKFARYLAESEVSTQRLHEQRDKIKTLVSDISHQTKTPIANILLYTQLLAEQELTEEGKRCTDALESQAEKLQTLIESMVKTSRLESGVITLAPKKDNLEKVIQRAVAQVAPKAEARQMQIELEVISEEAVFDAKWTEEAIYNLLDNAVKYTPAGGGITVGIKKYPMFTAIFVKDTGCGIEEEEQPKVFSRFYRGASHQEIEGVGIGLYLVRQIAEGQGGYVKVSSKKGEGTTFSLYVRNDENLSKL